MRTVDRAAGSIERAENRLDRIMIDARQSLIGVNADRIMGVLQLADSAISYLAIAERSRVKSSIPVSDGAVKFINQASLDIEMGTRALRRATALLADPDVDRDPALREQTLNALGLGQSHYRMAEWLLVNAGKAPVPPSLPPQTA
jgi:hypothetical protein